VPELSIRRKPFLEFTERFGLQGVPAHVGLLAHGDEAVLAQDAQLLRHAGLTEPGRKHQFPDLYRPGDPPTLGTFPKTTTSPGAHWLTFPSDHGTVVVQIPDSTGLTNDQILTFARGITVTDAVR